VCIVCKVRQIGNASHSRVEVVEIEYVHRSDFLPPIHLSKNGSD